jgi:hypothetical protein
MADDPKRPDDKPADEEPLDTRSEGEPDDAAEKIEEEGEPFDGNFA